MATMTFPLIGVTGRAHTGKDTVCRMASELVLADGLHPAIIACADPLKEICAKIYSTAFDVNRASFYGTFDDKAKVLWENEQGEWTGRRILQHIGTEGFRYTSNKVWSMYMIGRARKLLSEFSADVVFVSDVRFVQEAKTIQDAGGIILRMYRKSADELPITHSSEAECDNIVPDFTIDNEGKDLQSLHARVKDFLCQVPLHSLRSTSRQLG